MSSDTPEANTDRPEWTDPTRCPYEDCDFRGGEIHVECHLSEEHGWFLIERSFDSESLVKEREIDTGDQSTLGEVV